MSTEPKILPVVIIKPGAMTKEAQAAMNRAGITVVEAKDPSAIRFLNPPSPNRTAQEKAAIELCRVLLTSEGLTMSDSYKDFTAKLYIQCLLKGSAFEKLTVPSVPAVPPTPAKP